MRRFAMRGVRAVALAAVLAAVGGGARADAPDTLEGMWERPVALRDGVTVRAYALETPRLMKAYVVRVDLTTPGLGFAATARSPRWGEVMASCPDRGLRVGTTCETTADFMRRRRAAGAPVAVAVNAAPWSPFPPPKGEDGACPFGWNVSDGVEISTGASPTGALFVVRRDGRAAIVDHVPPAETNDVAFALCGFDIILSGGRARPEEGLRARGIHPRTAFGLTADRRTLVLLAVDGRQRDYSLGATLGDLCDILRREGVTDAINMDGGGSTSLLVWDRDRPRMLNRHPGGAVRANAVNFGLTFRPE